MLNTEQSVTAACPIQSSQVNSSNKITNTQHQESQYVTVKQICMCLIFTCLSVLMQFRHCILQQAIAETKIRLTKYCHPSCSTTQNYIYTYQQIMIMALLFAMATENMTYILSPKIKAHKCTPEVSHFKELNMAHSPMQN